jgi:ribonuclease III
MAGNNRNSGAASELKQANPAALESGGEELSGTDLSGIEKLLAHRFRRRELLTQALTHRSLAYEHKKDSDPAVSLPSSDNEQLEFLGDAVIGFLAADDLCRRYPELNEGQLTRLRAELVSRKHLGEVAARLSLGTYMLLGRGEERSGGRKNNALLANCIEAVVAALYLDAGIDHTRKFVAHEVIEPSVDTLRERMLGGSSIGDHKSALQELVQAQKLGAPEYLVKAESGPDHRKRFLVEVFVADKDTKAKALARGVGNTKKKAEQEAARQALARLQRRKRVTPRTGSDL